MLVAPFLPFAAPRTRTFSSSALLELEAPPCRFSFRSFPVCRSEFLSFRQLKPGKRNGQGEDSPKLPFELAYGERRGWAQSLTDRAYLGYLTKFFHVLFVQFATPFLFVTTQLFVRYWKGNLEGCCIFPVLGTKLYQTWGSRHNKCSKQSSTMRLTPFSFEWKRLLEIDELATDCDQHPPRGAKNDECR